MPRTDELIKQDVVDQLVRDPRLDASHITVDVTDGIVYLSGDAPSLLGKQVATEDALSLFGVVDAVNNIEVRYPSTVSLPADSEIAASLRVRLAANPDVDITDLDITVAGGVVTLRGTVDTFWKKSYVASLVVGEPGVTYVVNELAVVPTGDFIDEDIARDVVASLEARALVNADNVEVRVSDGKVYLTGTVSGRAARSAAVDAALYTAGVVEVVDNLKVVPV